VVTAGGDGGTGNYLFREGRVSYPAFVIRAHLVHAPAATAHAALDGPARCQWSPAFPAVPWDSWLCVPMCFEVREPALVPPHFAPPTRTGRSNSASFARCSDVSGGALARVRSM
jgi:hypothetical protein